MIFFCQYEGINIKNLRCLEVAVAKFARRISLTNVAIRKMNSSLRTDIYIYFYNKYLV